MQLPKNAIVETVSGATPGDLLVIPSGSEGPCLVAIRANAPRTPHDLDDEDAVYALPHAVAINASTATSRPLPHLQEFRSNPEALNLKRNWFVDVDPKGISGGSLNGEDVLLRVEGTYFLRLDGGGFLNLSNGEIQAGPPFARGKHFVTWNSFSIRAKHPDEDASEELCRWEPIARQTG